MRREPGAAGRRTVVVRALLAVALVLLTARVLVHATDFVARSSQQDLAAYWAAGRADAAGLSPYVNHVVTDPALWDGISVWRHSRFVYPPLVATAFRPLGALDYATAKTVWMAVLLGSLVLAWWLSARLARLDATRRLALAVVFAAYFPVLALLERGQLDSLTLCALLGAIRLFDRARDSARAPLRESAGGALLVAATWIKLHAAFALPWLVLRRRWAALGGFAAAAASLVLVGAIVPRAVGPLDYARAELPRIARHGDQGSAADRLPPGVLLRALGGVAPGQTRIDGEAYDVEALDFTINASLVRTPLGRASWEGLRAVGLEVAPAQVSLVFFALALVLLVFWYRRHGEPRGPGGELAGWMTWTTAMLLCAPLSWAMGTVWLLPIAALVLHALTERDRRTFVALAGAGLLVAAVPGPWLAPAGTLARHQYVIAELLCLSGLLTAWRSQDSPSTAGDALHRARAQDARPTRKRSG